MIKASLNWDDLPDVISVKEASAVVRVSRDKIYELAKQDGFPCVWIGKRVRISRNLFRKWIESNGKISFPSKDG